MKLRSDDDHAKDSRTDLGPVRVALGGFDPLVRSGVLTALGAEPRIEVVESPPSASGATRLDARSVDVAVVDARRFSGAGGVLDLIRGAAPTGVVFLADGHRLNEISALLTSVAGSCVAADCPGWMLTQVVLLTADGMQVRPPIDGPTASLTLAEDRVLTLLRIGQSNSEIAAALHVSVETVRTHARRIYAKLGVSGRDALRLVGGPASRRDA